MSSNPRTTRESLLAPVSRWTWLTKFWLCHGIDKGTVTWTQAMRAHELSSEELERWFSLYRQSGANGLRRINKTHRGRAA